MRPFKSFTGIVSCLIIAIGLSHLAVAADEPLEFAVLKEAYVRKLEALAADTAKREVDPLIKKYDEALDRVETEEAEAGRLETVLMVREERARVAKEKGIKEEQIVKEVPAMTKLQSQLLRKMAEIEIAEKPQRKAVTEIYVKKLKELKIKFTKQKKIEAAVLVAAELEKVSQSLSASTKPLLGFEEDQEARSKLEGDWEVTRYDGHVFGIATMSKAGKGKLRFETDVNWLKRMIGIYEIEGKDLRKMMQPSEKGEMVWKADAKGFVCDKKSLFPRYRMERAKEKKGETAEN